ncbi:TPA: pathogenicity island protein [Staphylococcus aureus]
MNRNRMKQIILEYIKNNDSTSFVEIENVFEEQGFKYKGNGAYTSGNHKNIIFWMGWNEEAFNIVADLKRDGLIEMQICPPMYYLIDGKGLRLPIVKNKNIKIDHWLPITFSLVN